MGLPDSLHCPDCRSRLDVAATGYQCAACGRTVPVEDGVADLLDEGAGPGLFAGDNGWQEPVWAGIADRVRAAAGDRWPQNLGHVLELGCGPGQWTSALLASARVERLTAIDADKGLVAANRARLASMGLSPERPAVFAAASGRKPVIRDASADTVTGMTMLTRAGDLASVLRTTMRALRPGGRAFYVVPNRRYWRAACLSVAEAWAQADERTDANGDVARFLAHAQISLRYRDDPALLARLRERRFADSDHLEAAAREAGFATAEALPLDPDPAGGDSIMRMCLAAGIPEEPLRTLVPLAAAAGGKWFGLLSPQDQSAATLLWLTKASGPRVAIFQAAAPPDPTAPDAADEGARARWSLDLRAEATDDGIELALSGWCLAGTDVLWVRIALDDVIQQAPVWRPRPDVHAVINRSGTYHPLSALCSGVEATMAFQGVQPVDGACKLRLEVVLADGIVVPGHAPGALPMASPLVLAQ